MGQGKSSGFGPPCPVSPGELEIFPPCASVSPSVQSPSYSNMWLWVGPCPEAPQGVCVGVTAEPWPQPRAYCQATVALDLA